MKRKNSIFTRGNESQLWSWVIIVFNKRVQCWNVLTRCSETSYSVTKKPCMYKQQGRINAWASRGWSPGAYTGKGAHWLAAGKLYFFNNYLYWSLQHSVNKHALIFSNGEKRFSGGRGAYINAVAQGPLVILAPLINHRFSFWGEKCQMVTENTWNGVKKILFCSYIFSPKNSIQEKQRSLLAMQEHLTSNQ